MTEKLVLLDMDGVLCEFNDAAYRVHGKEPPDDPQWGIWDDLGITEAEFWRPMGYEFWAGLDWTAEGRWLIAGLENLVDHKNIALLTSPCETPGCYDGKREWVRKNLPDYRNFIPTSAKHFIAGAGKILVDDRNENVDNFARLGGQGVLVPRTWNRRRDETTNKRFSVGCVLKDIEQALYSS